FLSRLPSELALCILFALEDHVDVLAAAAVSRSWRRLALDGSVWRHLFFSHPGWAIREDAPLVLQHQAELRRIQIRAANLSANYFAASLDWIKLYRDRFVLDQRWFSGKRARGEDGVAKPFEPTRRYLCGHEDSVYCVRQDDGVGTGTSGKLVSGSRDRTIRIWDAESGECRHILRGHTASVLSLQYDDQILVSGSSDSEVFVWDFAAIMATPSGPRQEAGQKKADPVTHGRHRVLTKLRGHSSAVLDVAFDADWIVTSSKDASVRVWKRSDYSLYRKFTHGGPVNAVDLQGGRIVTASGDGSMFLWDIEQGSAIHAFQGHSKGLACISFRGDTVVSGSNDQTIRIWNANTGRCRKVLQGHSELVRTVGYCPVRELVVSGGYDRAIKIWDARTEDDRPDTQPRISRTCLPIRDLKCHRARVFDIDLNTTRIVSASEDHSICISFFGGQGIDTALFV
ncbi:WD40 repeat-like protein, partial [Testicularia cyperi]